LLAPKPDEIIAPTLPAECPGIGEATGTGL